MNRLLLSLSIGVFAIPAAANDDYVELFEKAAEAVNWDFEEEWAFTETRLQDDLLWVARFDPRNPEDERWTLISVDGRAPSADERSDFAHDKADHDSSDSSQRVDIVGMDSLELVEETDERWIFRFTPEDDGVEFMQSVDAVLNIVKDGHWLESIDIRNHSEIKPGFGTRISTFLVQMQFGPATDDGPIVPLAMKVKVSGRMLLFIGFDESEIVSYKDFEYAGAETSAPDAG